MGKIDFKEICREIRCEEYYSKKLEELTDNERYYLDTDVENNYKNMKKNLLELLPVLGLDPDNYKKGNKILIPIDEKEFCKRAYKERTSSIGKKMRGKSKKEITYEDIEKEIESIEKIAFQTLSEEDAKMEIGKIKYEQNYHILRKIEELKKVLEDYIYKKIKNITIEDFMLSRPDALYLIDYFAQEVVKTLEKWEDVVKNYKDIRNEEIFSRVAFNEKTGEYYTDESIEFASPESVLKKSLERLK